MMGQRPGLRPVLVSVGLHLAIVVPMVAFTRLPEPIEFETVRVNLVLAPEPAPQVVTQPEPEPEVRPAETTPEPEPEPEPERRPDPPPQREQRTERRPEPEQPRPQPAEPTPDARQGGDPVTVQTEGRDFPFPDYLNNVVRQVHRYFRWDDDSQPRGTIYFEIHDDGRVRNIRMVQPSGNLRFDFAVQGAVEQAGNRGAFGPLPDGFAAPFLPIQLVIEPPR